MRSRYGAAALSTAGITTATPVASPRRYLAHTAAFSRLANIRQVIEFLSARLGLRLEDIRLWHVKDVQTLLLEDENATLQDLGMQDNEQILLEVRNKDLTWPEELGALVSGNTTISTLISSERRPTITLPPGRCGEGRIVLKCNYFFLFASCRCYRSSKFRQHLLYERSFASRIEH